MGFFSKNTVHKLVDRNGRTLVSVRTDNADEAVKEAVRHMSDREYKRWVHGGQQVRKGRN